MDAGSIRYAIEFSTAARKKSFASFSELLKFFKKHRPPMSICLIGRAEDNLINFQAVLKKRGFTSFDELLKYCMQFSLFQQQ